MARRLAISAMSCVLILIAALPASATSPPEGNGRAVLLMDGVTGQVLYQQNGSNRNFPASTTKLLTALVAVEHGKLDQKIRISKEAVAKGPDSASCYVNEGEEQPLEYLLYGMLLRSGNDCADAIAEGLAGGNRDQFITWMNETAQRLGSTNSHFVNPHGLHENDHYISALDMALIARAALANPVIREISGTKEWVWPGKNNGTYYHTNNMIHYYDGVVGGKNGFTEEARYTLVTAAERDGLYLIGVTLGFEDKVQLYTAMEGLLDYGFANFVKAEAVGAGSPLGEIQVEEGKQPKVPVMAGTGFAVSRPKDGPQSVTVIPKLQDQVKAPVTQGQNLGVLEIRDGDRLLGTVPALASQAVEARPQWGRDLGSWVLTGLKWLLSLLVGLWIFRTVVRTVRRTLRRRRMSGGHSQRASGTRSIISSYRTRMPR